MKVLNVPDIHCGVCVKRIEKALSEENIQNETDLKTKTVTIKKDSEARRAAEILSEIGFEVK